MDDIEVVDRNYHEMEEADSSSDEKYDSDLVIIFPYKRGGEKKSPEKFTQDEYVRKMLGLRKKKNFMENGSVRVIKDETKVVFRSPRCFLDDDGESDHLVHCTDGILQDEKNLELYKRILRKEYVNIIGHDQGTTEVEYCALIAKSVAKRVQVACGLTAYMHHSVDDDEIIMTIQADENDLRTEADRIDYRLALSNRPFDRVHEKRNERIRAEIGDAAFEQSVAFLRNTRGGEMELPEMDEHLISQGKEKHPKLYKALNNWGHHEEADGGYYGSAKHSIAQSFKKKLENTLFYISQDHLSYFSPYVAYKTENMYQPYYRQYPLTEESRTEDSIFRQVDRIRLCLSIMERHIGLDALKEIKYIVDYFAMHDPKYLKALRKDWALNLTLTSQPIMRIRNYFGEKQALYFAWLEFYAKMLVLPSIAGIVVFAMNQLLEHTDDDSPVSNSTSILQVSKRQDGYYLIGFAGLVIVWSVAFTEFWKRKNALYNTLWGVDDHDTEVIPRSQFVGEVRRNPVHDQPEMWHESMRIYKRRILISMVVVAMMIGIVLVALYGLFELKARWTTNDPNGEDTIQYASQIVSVLNAFQILILNVIYKFIAIRLTEWENHRSDVVFENHLIRKVFLFQFVNSFASIFYIAFFKGKSQCVDNDCFQEVQYQLAIIFIIKSVVGNVMEVLQPFLKYRFRLWNESRGVKSTSKPIYGQAEKQAKLNPYEEMESFADYNEMVIQFGFVTLFVVAFPLAPLLALVNNIVEVHVDAFKLCVGHRRPRPHKARSIGSWFFFLRLMSNIAIATNSALILFSTDLFENATTEVKLLVFLLVEHICVAIKVTAEKLVRSTPAQLKILRRRFAYIEAVVFKGVLVDDDSHLVELSERVSLSIHDNPNWDKTTAL